MSTQNFSTSAKRTKVAVSSKGNGDIHGKVSGNEHNAPGHKLGSAIPGFSGSGTKGGKVKG